MIHRKILLARQRLLNGKWDGWGPSETLGEKVMGKKVGIIGMGRIGLAVAKRLFTLGMHIHYHNRNRLKKNLEKKVYVLFIGMNLTKCYRKLTY